MIKIFKFVKTDALTLDCNKRLCVIGDYSSLVRISPSFSYYFYRVNNFVISKVNVNKTYRKYFFS